MAHGTHGLHALALNCTLKASPAPSSTAKLADEVLAELARFGIVGEQLRVADYDVKAGVSADEGGGDQWPILRQKILAADILVLATPTWMGHASSFAQRVLERLDAELSVTDDDGRVAMTNRVAIVAVVGNEDGAHKVIADLFQGLNDVGYSVPAQGSSYWNGEAMHTVDYNTLPETPAAVRGTNATVARNASHLAQLLNARPYLPVV